MKAKLNEIIKHGHLGIIAAFFAIYMVTFSYIENRDVHHYIVHTVLDEKIPFCEYFIIPYLLWFIFVAVTVLYFMFFNQNKWKEYYQLMITLGIGMTLFLVISLVFPNGQDLRPVLSGNRYRSSDLNDINYHVNDASKTTQRCGRSTRNPHVYCMLQDCIRQRSMETGCILFLFIYQSLNEKA